MAGRHTTAVRDEREAFMLGIFKATPGLSAAKANEAFKAKFGSMMRNKRVYELRVAAEGVPQTPAAPPPTTVEAVAPAASAVAPATAEAPAALAEPEVQILSVKAAEPVVEAPKTGTLVIE